MASPADAAPSAAPSPASPPLSRSWKGWLLIGTCFALGYGITQRLVSIRLESGLGGGQRFEVKSFPGTELDGLRRRFGDASSEIRGNLDLLELERQQQKDAAAIEQRRADMEAREQGQPHSPEPNQPPVSNEADGAAAPLPEAPELPPPPEPEAAAPANPPPAPTSPGTTP